MNQIEIELNGDSGIPDLNADIVITDYTEGDYEGGGVALVKIGQKWTLHDLGHCSCYGPWDQQDYDHIKSDPIDFLKNGTTIYDELLPLLKELDSRKLLSKDQSKRLQPFL